jgi:hypothetical protein
MQQQVLMVGEASLHLQPVVAVVVVVVVVMLLLLLLLKRLQLQLQLALALASQLLRSARCCCLVLLEHLQTLLHLLQQQEQQ